VISVNALLRVLAAAGAAALFALLFGGAPGKWEDPYRNLLLTHRKPVPVARELLLLPMGDPAQGVGSAAPGRADLIWTLAELRAERVLLPPSWASGNAADADPSPSTDGIASRLDREFDRIDENIATLFEAIRIGAIDPTEADRFVNELRRLVSESKSRIRDGVEDGTDPQESSLEGLISVFGKDRIGTEPSDLGVSLPRYPSATARPIPPGGGDGVAGLRQLDTASIGEYISLRDRLAEELAVLEGEGYFDEVDPADRPSALRTRLRALREDVSARPSLSRVEAWREAADGYHHSVGILLDPEAEARLTARFVALEGATEGIAEETAAQIRGMRRDLEAAFTSLRADHAAVVAAREELSDAVAGSFVVIQEDGIGDDERAIAVNGALVGEHLRVPFGRSRVALLAAIGLLLGVLLSPFSFRTAFALSPAGLLVGAIIFPALFLAGDVWVDPASALGTVIAATGGTLAVAGLLAARTERVLAGRGVYRLPPRRAGRVARRGHLPKPETGRRLAAALVVAPEGRDGSRAVDLASFHRGVARRIRQLGGVVLGEDGLTVIAAVPAPVPARVSGRAGGASRPESADTRLAAHACAVVKELIAKPLPGGVAIRCGAEVGELLFYLSPIGGYRASGRALRYARRFCDLARKHRYPALFGENIVAACGPGGDARRFQEAGRLTLPNAEGGYPFYRLTETDLPSR
jgi:hypothetical protein